MSTLFCKNLFCLQINDLQAPQAGGHIANGDVQGVEFFHLGDRPCPLLPVPAHLAALMAGLAQGHAGVVQPLLDVVGVAGTGLAADAAGLLLDQRHPATLA